VPDIETARIRALSDREAERLLSAALDRLDGMAP
jgi:hypothetical protein